MKPVDKELQQQSATIGVGLLRRAFVELAEAFAQRDASAAEEAINRVESEWARQFSGMRQKLPQAEAAQKTQLLSYTATSLRDTIRLARDRIRAAAQPRH